MIARSTLIACSLLAMLPSLARSDTASSFAAGQVLAGRTTITLPDTTGYSPFERLILALEIERSAAIARRDTTWLASLYAPDFTGVAANGRRIDRPALFQLFGGDNPENRFFIDELMIHGYGTAATVSGRLRMLTSAGDVTGDSRYLHVYLQREGHWWIVAAGATMVPPGSAIGK